MLDVYDQVHTEETTPMALSDSALSELLDALRVGDGTDLVRELAQWALQQFESPWVRWRLWGALGSVESGCWTSGCCRWFVSSFELDGCEHAKC